MRFRRRILQNETGGNYLEIEKLKSYHDGGVSREEAAELLKSKPLLTNLEWDAILQDETLREKYKDYYPALTGTHLKYEGNTGILTEDGKSHPRMIPERDGWYETDIYGMPFGKPSSSDNPNARYLFRQSSFSGLVVRYGSWGVVSRHGVGGYVGHFRFGVLGRVDKSREKKNLNGDDVWNDADDWFNEEIEEGARQEIILKAYLKKKKIKNQDVDW